jgi:hypothetical protein
MGSQAEVVDQWGRVTSWLGEHAPAVRRRTRRSRDGSVEGAVRVRRPHRSDDTLTVARHPSLAHCLHQVADRM